MLKKYNKNSLIKYKKKKCTRVKKRVKKEKKVRKNLISVISSF